MKTTIRSNSTRSERGAGRLAVGVASVAAGLALLLTPHGAGGQVVANDLTNSITITQTPSGVTGDCVPASLAIANGTVTNFVSSDASIFKLTVHSSAPLCEALTGKAVVYAMPGGGVAWPQTLKQVKAFSILEAGSTEISFAKTCDPAQFDVLGGDSATPEVIAPDGAAHGPLLFPFDDGTAFQHVGNAGCNEASTTSASTTQAPTTTAAVQGTSTIAVTTTTAAQKPVVLGVTTTVPSTSGNTLAVTGSTSGPFALIGGGLVFIGLAAMLASRRRTA